jgi:hypothetical protein
MPKNILFQIVATAIVVATLQGAWATSISDQTLAPPQLPDSELPDITTQTTPKPSSSTPADRNQKMVPQEPQSVFGLSTGQKLANS